MDSLNVDSGAEALRPTDSGKHAYLALLGCALLQLPIWGFAVSYGVLQEYYTSHVELKGNLSTTGIIGTTLNGIMYISMPFLFGIFTYRYAHLRRQWAIFGIALSTGSLVLSSFGIEVWHIVLTQGILQAFGSTILYSSTTIYIDEWFVLRKGFAYGVVLSVKAATGVGVPLLFGALLSHLGFRNALRIWSAITFAMAAPAVFLLKPRFNNSRDARRTRKLSWTFLHHPTFWAFQVANIVFAASYGMPQTYLSTYATISLNFSSSNGALILAALNILNVYSSFWFGQLSDGKPVWRGKPLTISMVSLLSAMGSCLPVLLFWGLVPEHSAAGVALVIIFAFTYGFFAGGYSATWGGVLKEIQKEAEANNEAVDTALVYGLLNGGRGIGYVSGGFIGVGLLQAGAINSSRFAYGSNFGSLILFTGVGAAVGGSSILWRNARLMKFW